MFAPFPRLGKNVNTNTSVKAKIFDNHSLAVLREINVPIKAGSDIILDIPALHMNRRLFPKFLIDFLLTGLPFSFFVTKHSLGDSMLGILNRRGSLTLTIITGLVKHVRDVTCSNPVSPLLSRPTVV